MIVSKSQKYKKRKTKATMPEPKPCWVQAFMIKLLYTNAVLRQRISGKPEPAQMSLTLSELEKFEALGEDNQTVMNYDPDTKTVIIQAPEMIMPEKPKLVLSDKTIIT